MHPLHVFAQHNQICSKIFGKQSDKTYIKKPPGTPAGVVTCMIPDGFHYTNTQNVFKAVFSAPVLQLPLIPPALADEL